MSRNCTLYVSGFHYSTRADDLAEEFIRFGPLVRCDIPGRTGGKTFAFVEFKRPRDAEDALEGMRGRLVDGRPLMVEFTRRPPPQTWRSDDLSRLGPGVGGGEYGGHSTSLSYTRDSRDIRSVRDVREARDNRDSRDLSIGGARDVRDFRGSIRERYDDRPPPRDRFELRGVGAPRDRFDDRMPPRYIDRLLPHERGDYYVRPPIRRGDFDRQYVREGREDFRRDTRPPIRSAPRRDDRLPPRAYRDDRREREPLTDSRQGELGRDSVAYNSTNGTTRRRSRSRSPLLHRKNDRRISLAESSEVAVDPAPPSPHINGPVEAHL
eukprot:Ihof_evm8s171 gene=Ihof_evmTU8s171